MANGHPQINYDAELAKAGANVDGWWSKTLYLIRRYPLGAVGAVIVAVLLFAAIFADVVAPYDPLQTGADRSLSEPGGNHLLGADVMGRDMYSRIIHGARISLAVGIASTLIGGGLGVIIGLLSGYLLGWFDLIMQRIMDIMQALPLLVMALVMVMVRTGRSVAIESIRARSVGSSSTNAAAATPACASPARRRISQ